MKLHNLVIWFILGIFILLESIIFSYAFQGNSASYTTDNKLDMINGINGSSSFEQRISGGIEVVGTYTIPGQNLIGRFGILGESNCSNIISSCTDWSSCSENIQSRICTDTAGCTRTENQSCGGCGKTCYNQGYECGIVTLCYRQVNCGSCLSNETCSNNKCIPSCTPDWQCGDWSDCVNSTQTRICTDFNGCNTNISKPFEIQSCPTNITNITCMENWQCDWSDCDGSYHRYSNNCIDLNKCGTTYIKPKSKQNCYCMPDWRCNFSTCQVGYDIDKILRGVPIRDGIQTILCKDLNKCENSTINFANCSLVSEVDASISEFCHEKYVEIRDKQTGKLVSRLKQSYFEGVKRVDIGLTASEDLTGYCPHCSNKIKDFEETDIDCGGPDCPLCKKLGSKYFDWLFILKLILWIIAIALIIFFLYKRRKDNISHILRLIDKGEAFLKRHKIRQSKSVYKEVKKDFNELDAPSKKEVKKNVVTFYKDIVKAIKKVILRRHKK